MQQLSYPPISEADQDLVERAATHAYAQLGILGGDITDLDLPLQTVAVVNVVQPIVDNGGFQYLFGRDFDFTPPYSLLSDAYRRIGADAAANLIDRAVSLFPFHEPHLRERERQRFMKSLPQNHEMFDLGYKLCGDKAVWQALADYVKNNLSAFRLTN